MTNQLERLLAAFANRYRIEQGLVPFVAGLVMVACAAPHSEERADEQPPTAFADSAAVRVRRGDVRQVDRAAWREVLNWTNDCEEAFQSTHAGEGTGIELQSLGEQISLVAVLCVAGSYQPSFMYYYLDEGSSPPLSAVISFPTYESPDGRTLIRAEHTELWGEARFVPERRELYVLNVSRQTRDCGSWARYAFVDHEVQLREFWVRLPCPEEIEQPVDPQPGVPPDGWTRVNGG